MTHAQRIREIRARGRIRRWEYRQRNLAHGAWLRFRTALAQAERAFRISPSSMRRSPPAAQRSTIAAPGWSHRGTSYGSPVSKSLRCRERASWCSGSTPRCWPPSIWLS